MRYLTRGRGEVSERDVSPQRLVHYRNTWYVDAWCHTREKMLRFALDAIEAAAALETKAKDVPLKQVEAEMDGGYGIYAGGEAPVGDACLRRPGGPVGQPRGVAPGAKRALAWRRHVRLEVPYVNETELVMDILRHGEQVSVIEPEALRRTVGKRLGIAATRYADPQQSPGRPA